MRETVGQKKDKTRFETLRWKGEGAYSLPAWGGELIITRVSGDEAGIAEEYFTDRELQARPRQGGEKLKLYKNRPRKHLKDLYQKAEIAEFDRSKLPLLWSGEDLIFAAGLGMDVRYEGDPTVAQVVAPVIAGFLATAICGVGLFIVAAIVLNLLAGALSKLFDKIPVIGAINHILGLALGLIKGLIFVYIILGVCSVIPVQAVQDTLAETTVIQWLYETNLIMLAIENISALTPIVEYVQDFINGLMGGGEGTETAAVILASLPL